MRGYCRPILWLLCLLPVLLLASCASGPGGGSAYAPTRYYPPPGPADDPWGPYIDEASARFDVPAQWIRAVMAQESGGEEQAVSPVGAIGLMQLMPSTWDSLRDENSLGSDPFNPQDNILAGTAYIHQMYLRYGAPAFLAAYNAGPERLDDYLAGNGPLPDETVNYLASVTPNLGDQVAMTGPLAGYANGSAASVAAPTATGFATGCDVNAAYDPAHPCAVQPAEQVAEASPASAPALGAAPTAGVCNPDIAYDPQNPCAAMGSGAAGACNTDVAYDPDSPCAPVTGTPGTVIEASTTPAETAQVQAAAVAAPPAGSWGIQVGAFTSVDLARQVAASAVSELPQELTGAVIEAPPVTTTGGAVVYRARLGGLSAAAALNACGALNQRQLPCIVLPAKNL